uniref:Uncharacterized protein n=1 Tax=Arundo donax TaxID=35708 RepID=A0A0A9FYW6_ARUDO
MSKRLKAPDGSMSFPKFETSLFRSSTKMFFNLVLISLFIATSMLELIFPCHQIMGLEIFEHMNHQYFLLQNI